MPRKFNVPEKKIEDKIKISRIQFTNRVEAEREAAIAYFANADAVAAVKAVAIDAAAVEIVDVPVDEPAAVAIVVDIEEKNQRPRLPDFVPPPTFRRFHCPYDRSPSPIDDPPTPPGHPESEEDDFIPNLSDCEVRSEVGTFSEDDSPEPTPLLVPPSPPRKLVRVRNIKSNKTRCVGLKEISVQNLKTLSSVETNWLINLLPNNLAPRFNSSDIGHFFNFNQFLYFFVSLG
jgi:hypothetical protein